MKQQLVRSFGFLLLLLAGACGRDATNVVNNGILPKPTTSGRATTMQKSDAVIDARASEQAAAPAATTPAPAKPRGIVCGISEISSRTDVEKMSDGVYHAAHPVFRVAAIDGTPIQVTNVMSTREHLYIDFANTIPYAERLFSLPSATGVAVDLDFYVRYPGYFTVYVFVKDPTDGRIGTCIGTVLITGDKMPSF